jgi:hypothetical protein
LDTVLEIVGNEMDALDDVFKSPQDELSEESLLSIKWKEMTADVCHEAPIPLHGLCFVMLHTPRNRSPGIPERTLTL